MHTPYAALAWELWRRHRLRVIGIGVVLLAFIVAYLKMCAAAGFNLSNADTLEELGKLLAQDSANGPLHGPLLRVLQLLNVLFLACAPTVLMMVTLLTVVWMFTLTEIDRKWKDPFRFPARFFVLPVSTPFLFWWPVLGGLAVVGTLYSAWIFLVRQPNTWLFGMHQNCLGWMTMLVVAQAIVWCLAAWPGLRILVLMVTLGCFFACEPRYNIFEFPILLPVAAVMAYAGLQKMRHGQWQGLDWERIWRRLMGRGSLGGPRKFSSPADAQLWCEWRKFPRSFCIVGGVVALLPLVIMLARKLAGWGPMPQDLLLGFAVFLFVPPVLLHFCTGMSAQTADSSFVMVRPLSAGSMVMSMLKAPAVSAACLWGMALLSAGILAYAAPMDIGIAHFPAMLAAIIFGTIFLTWRMAVINLCFLLTENRWLLCVPAGMFCIVCAGVGLSGTLENEQMLWNGFWPALSLLLLFLVAAKFLLACVSFGISLRRRLFTQEQVINYLTVWVLLVVALLGALALTRPDHQFIRPCSLAIVLLVPLARIGFCPIALAHARHA